MKKILSIIMVLCLLGCSTSSEEVKLSQKVQIEFYSVATCAECKAFKSHALVYFKKRYGKQVTVKMYDMDATQTKKPYDAAIKSLKDFDESYYGLSPFVYVKGKMAYLGYHTGDEKYMAQDIEAKLKGKALTKKLSGNRYLVK